MEYIVMLQTLLFTLLNVSTTLACQRFQQISLQPYTGENVAYPENYPQKKGYKANVTCSWNITTIRGFEIIVYPRWNCNSDTSFNLYHGLTTSAKKNEMVGCPHGESYGIMQTRTSAVLLTLSTLSSFNRGFSFRFMAVESNKDENCDPNGIKLLADKQPNFIVSPGFPAEYPSNLNCVWMVEPEIRDRNTHLVFQFRSVYLERGYDTCADYVQIDGLDKFCDDVENQILQSSPKIPLNKTSTKVSFISDIGFAGSGFVLAFYIEDNVQSCSCQNGGTCMNSTCICLRGYEGRNCEDETLKLLSFEISHPVLREEKPVWFKMELMDNFNHSHSVQWFRNGLKISNASMRYIMSSSRTANGTYRYMIYIPRVLKQDRGVWEVTVSNEVTTATRSVSLQVLPKLLLKMSPQYDFYVTSGEDINLHCRVINPESLNDLKNGSLIWQKDGRKILSLTDSVFNISRSNTYTTLYRPSASLTDSGNFSCFHSAYPDPVSVSVYINVIKPEQLRCPTENFEGITWNTTVAGMTHKKSCPKNQKGTATRYCDTQGIWKTPNFINCTSEGFVNASKELDSLLEDGLDSLGKVGETVNNTLVKMKNLTSKSNALSAGDISSSLDILEKIVDVTNLTSANIKKEVFFEIVDNVLSTNNSDSWTTIQKKTEKDASALLKNIDRLSEVIMKNNNVTATKFTGLNLEVTVDQTNVEESGIIFPDISSNKSAEVVDEYATFLELPKQTNKSKKAITYVAVIYKTITDILPTDSGGKDTASDGEIVNSEILSLTTQTDLGILFPPLNLTFQHKHKNKSIHLQALCVSWDFTSNKWSEEGCKINSTSNKRTVCQCNHLTNFAILMRPYSSESEDSASLKSISFIGVIVSIVFTMLTFIIYIVAWKHIKNDQNIMMLNLCGSLVVSYIVFISAVEETSNESLCIAITAVIHYLFLVTFFCMMGIGIYYFMSITVTYYALRVANNFKSISRVRWFLLGGWGIPLVIAGVTLGAFRGTGYHLKNYCWLSMESGSLYLFIIPVCLIAVINIIIIVSLIRVLLATSTMANSSLYKKAASGLRSLGTLVPVLGVTWIFGVLAVNDRAEIFQYIFIIANSLQGLFIFISHVVLNKKLIKGIIIKYPALSALSMLTESSKQESTPVTPTHSADSHRPIIKSRRKGILSKIGKSSNKKTANTKIEMETESFLTEKTDSSDFSNVSPQEKNRRGPRLQLKINKKKKYTLTTT
ncbi:adhesion G-protein coupled receptor F1-like [Saccostrea echinata]|uniref:adhesion G-protein coupled receptor F1-like n=1 Tax=Saccostrea echinata TaxID=191078 RepID=UPI002A80E83C|nr:adhesion G-protein coupled receptor F1-like [Saccostrea echinata]XP_061181252.1 adhesion G-protein coupled receptor F1-like [Saccostrea echinata]